MAKYFTYIIESTKITKFYIGYSTNVESRLIKHNSGGSRWTRNGIPWTIVYSKAFDNKTGAIKYEKFLKSLKNKNFLRDIIAGWRSGISQGS